MNPLTYLVVNLTLVALLLRGGVEVDAGALTQGEVIALINYMSQILLSLLRLADLVVSVTRALASGMRVNEIFKHPYHDGGPWHGDAGHSRMRPTRRSSTMSTSPTRGQAHPA